MISHFSTTGTTASANEVLAAAADFFSAEHFAIEFRTERKVTFAGKPRFPRHILAVIVLGYVCLIVPGIVLQVLLDRRFRRFESLEVTATSAFPGADVNIVYPGWAWKHVRNFMMRLPKTPMGSVVRERAG
jgi:hypothetical protein